MSEEVLWYIARISGLMAWILAFGALAAGLLARSEPAHGTSAGLWASDTRNLLGRLSVVALVLHGGATVSADRFGLPLQSALTGRAEGQWLVAALLIGVSCGWALLGTELVRLVLARLSSGADLALLSISAAVVAAGGYHGWELGSDTQNPLAIAVLVLSGFLLLGAAAIGLTSLFDGEDDLAAAPPAIVSHGENLMLGGTSGSERDRDPDELSPQPLQDAAAGPSVLLSRTVNQTDPDPDPGPAAAAERFPGPQIASARDISEATVDGNDVSDDTGGGPGAWSMRKLPDAPQPSHRKGGRR